MSALITPTRLGVISADEVSDIEQQLDDTNSKKEELQSEVTDLSSNLNNLESPIISTNNEIDSINEQIAKLETKSSLESSLAALGVPVDTPQEKSSSSVSPDGKGNKKAEVSRKQRRTSKQSMSQVETASSFCGTEVVSNPTKDFLDVGLSHISKNKVSFMTIIILPGF